MHRIVDFGIELVEKINEPKVVIIFDNGLRFEGFLKKKDGTANKKTLQTLVTCGLNNPDVSVVAEGPKGGALSLEKEFELDVITESVGDKHYQRVNWVRDPNETKSKFDRTFKMKGSAAVSKELSNLLSSTSVADDELPF